MNIYKMLSRALVPVIWVTVSGYAHAVEFDLKTHSMKYAGQKYFRDNAYSLDIGSYGEKKDKIGPAARLEEQNKIKREHLIGKVDVNGPFDVNWSGTSSNGFGSIVRFGSNGGKLSVGRDRAIGANLKLVSLEIPEGRLKSVLNNDARGALNYLRDEGKDARVVSEVFIVVEGSLAEKIDGGTEIMAQSGENLQITFKKSGTSTTTITFGKGDVLAYRMHKVKKWQKGKEKIDNLESDFKGDG